MGVWEASPGEWGSGVVHTQDRTIPIHVYDARAVKLGENACLFLHATKAAPILSIEDYCRK